MSLQNRLRQGYQRYVGDYRQYLCRRGFGDKLYDRPFFFRSFLACWAEPGFHRFWRMWNPGIGFLTFRLYLALGGRKHRKAATVATFAVNGLVHTMAICPFARRWSWTLIVTFLIFGLLTILSGRLESLLKQKRWPAIANLVVNVGSVVLSFDIGFRVNAILC